MSVENRLVYFWMWDYFLFKSFSVIMYYSFYVFLTSILLKIYVHYRCWPELFLYPFLFYYLFFIYNDFYFFFRYSWLSFSCSTPYNVFGRISSCLIFWERLYRLVSFTLQIFGRIYQWSYLGLEFSLRKSFTLQTYFFQCIKGYSYYLVFFGGGEWEWTLVVFFREFSHFIWAFEYWHNSHNIFCSHSSKSSF